VIRFYHGWRYIEIKRRHFYNLWLLSLCKKGKPPVSE